MNYNIGLFNDSFPPVMDGVGICVENYARWMQEKVGGVSEMDPVFVRKIIRRNFKIVHAH